MSAAAPARRAALSVLVQAEARDAYVRELLDRDAAVRALDARDAAFARRLALGVTVSRGQLDDALDRYLDKPKRVSARVRAALRIAAFELIYLGTSPEVAVSQGVELSRLQSRAATGLANAVLRRVAEGRDGFLAADDVGDEGTRCIVSAARRAGLPVWLAREIEDSLGAEHAAELFAAELEPAPVAVCLNPRLQGAGEPAGLVRGAFTAEVAAALGGSADVAFAGEGSLVVAREGSSTTAWMEPHVAGGMGPHADCGVARPVSLEPDNGHLPQNLEFGRAGETPTSVVPSSSTLLPPGCAVVADMAGFIATGVLERGMAVVSDANAQVVALAATRPGSCLEIGAGRGTKTFVMAAAACRERIDRVHVALDLYEAKCRQNMERLRAAGLDSGVSAIAGDATDLDRALAVVDGVAGRRRLFNTVLVDAPCSGTGTMRRHPEIPWRLARVDIASLGDLQLRMLREAARRVALGGLLVYATCSVLQRENGDVVEAFLASDAGSGFELVEMGQTVPAPGAFDGHFHAVMSRRP